MSYLLKNNDQYCNIRAIPFFREHVSSSFPRGNLLARKSRVKSNRIRSHWIQTVRNFSREQAVKICPRTRASRDIAGIWRLFSSFIADTWETRANRKVANRSTATFFSLLEIERIFEHCHEFSIHHVISPRMFLAYKSSESIWQYKFPR